MSTESERPEHELQWAEHVERVLHAQTRRGSECVRRLVPALTAADCWTSCDFVVVSPSTCSHLQTCDRRRWRHRLLQQQQQLRNWIIKHSRFTGEARRHSELQTWVIVIMWHNKTIVLEVKLWRQGQQISISTYTTKLEIMTDAQAATNWKPVWDFLLVINNNWHIVSYRFEVIADYCTNFGHCVFEPPFGPVWVC